MELVLNAASAVGSFIAGFTNYITDLFLTPPLTATLRYLEDTDLKTLTGGESQLALNHRRASVFINSSNTVGCVELKRAIVQLLLRVLTLLPHFFITPEKQTVKAKSLWKSSGAVIMAVRRPG